MSGAAVVVALATALDVGTIRRLADYGTLDDAGVARALEQVHMQRWGRADVPAHLSRIDALAAIVDDGDRLDCISLAAPSGENTCLAELFARWPDQGVAPRLVDWDGTARSTLIARAVACEQVAPADLSAAPALALADQVAPAPAGHPAPADQVECECLQLMGALPDVSAFASIGERAAARYRLWLRVEYCAGRLDAAARHAAEKRLAAVRTAA